MAINVPPDPITSPHAGNRLDLIRQAIMSAQMYREGETDDQEIAAVHKCIGEFQKILAAHAANRDAALGITPAMKHARRAVAGY